MSKKGVLKAAFAAAGVSGVAGVVALGVGALPFAAAALGGAAVVGGTAGYVWADAVVKAVNKAINNPKP